MILTDSKIKKKEKKLQVKLKECILFCSDYDCLQREVIRQTTTEFYRPFSLSLFQIKFSIIDLV